MKEMEINEKLEVNGVTPKPKKIRLKPNRPRYTPFTEEQKSILAEHFKMNTNPRKEATTRIALSIGLTQMQVKNWFNNTRQKLRRIHESEMECAAPVSVEQTLLHSSISSSETIPAPLTLNSEELTNPHLFPLIMPLLLPAIFPSITTKTSSTDDIFQPVQDPQQKETISNQKESCSEKINFSIEKLLSKC
uniref:Homeobox domain-containing protein n=1 Tax=Caenorhabditis tropicalis TaxID=1561998 RepID=A0A1I7TLT6_9PELO